MECGHGKKNIHLSYSCICTILNRVVAPYFQGVNTQTKLINKVKRKIKREKVYVKVVLVKSEANILDRVVVVVGIVVEGVMGAGAIATPNA